MHSLNTPPPSTKYSAVAQSTHLTTNKPKHNPAREAQTSRNVYCAFAREKTTKLYCASARGAAAAATTADDEGAGEGRPLTRRSSCWCDAYGEEEAGGAEEGDVIDLPGRAAGGAPIIIGTRERRRRCGCCPPWPAQDEHPAGREMPANPVSKHVPHCTVHVHSVPTHDMLGKKLRLAVRAEALQAVYLRPTPSSGMALQAPGRAVTFVRAPPLPVQFRDVVMAMGMPGAGEDEADGRGDAVGDPAHPKGRRSPKNPESKQCPFAGTVHCALLPPVQVGEVKKLSPAFQPAVVLHELYTRPIRPDCVETAVQAPCFIV